MKARLTVICPSRARPDKAHKLFQSFMDSRSSDQARLLFAVDTDDESAVGYPPGTRRYGSHSAVEAMNLALRDVSSQYIGFVGDDCRFVTEDWDVAVLAALDAQGGGVVYPNDLVIPGSLPGICFMSTAICRAVGYFALPVLKINYFDNVWADLGKGLGKYRYLPDVAVQHLSLPHWWKTKEEGERHEARVREDARLYALWARDQRAADIEKART